MNTLKLNDFLQILLGSIILALGYGLFIIPHNIVPGGILGLSIVINQFIALPIGSIALCINIPLLLLGTKILGKQTGIKTAISMISVSVFIDIVLYFIPKQPLVNDPLVSSVFGGVLIGLAVVIVMKSGATTGGNDILVRVLSKKIKRPFNEMILIIDGIIVGIGIVAFGDFTLSAYCIVSIISISQAINYFMKKDVENKTILVFSENNIHIQNTLRNTYIGQKSEMLKYMHIENPNKLILITKSNKEVIDIKETISKTDPKAFVIQINSNDI